MSTLTLILKEMRYRKGNFLLTFVGILAAVSLVVAFSTTASGYRRETRRLMRNMGQNLRIIPRETAMDDFWIRGYSQETMPEEYVHRFADLEGYDYTHLTATLHKPIEWRGMSVLLTGILPEVLPADRRFQSPMMFSVDTGKVRIGSAVAGLAGLEEGEILELRSRALTVIEVLPETGAVDDIRVYGHLHDVQEILGLPGRINEIKALECLCKLESGGTDLTPLELAQQQLAEILPEAKVLMLQGIATIREKQRAAMEGYLALVMALSLIACAAWIAVLALMNVRERQHELGIMRAIGYQTRDVAALFLGRVALIGLAAGLTGYGVGTWLALHYGPGIFKVTANAIRPDYGLLFWALLAAPLFAALASLIPVAVAVTRDPVVSLRKE